VARARLELVKKWGGGTTLQETWSGRGSKGEAAESLALLRSLAGERAQLEARIRVTVQTLRGAGASWSVIGDALGVSRSAAQKRFGADELSRA